ncbi:MAG: glucosaminidase domain-containing protein [Enhydrobacter sp.]|nr:MAG: glucosaminidase domain-containing protein [Enhydrobacter sp.]
MLAAGVSLHEPAAPVDIAEFFTLRAEASPSLDPEPPALVFVADDILPVPEAILQVNSSVQGHGRFAAPGNAARRVKLRAINPVTADELAGFFREVSYTLTDVRLGEAVPPIKVERVPADLVNKEGNERKTLFITALLPVVLEANQRVIEDREHLLDLRSKLDSGYGLLPFETIWLEQLAERYQVSADQLDELLNRVDIVPPSMAIAQAGVESGWGTSFAARMGNALFGQIQSIGHHAVKVPWKPGPAMPQPFESVGEAAAAYVYNLNTHAAYAGFRAERAAMRELGKSPDGYRLIGTLLRYSELGQEYVRFVRRIMRENSLADFDDARLSDVEVLHHPTWQITVAH